MGFFFQKKLDGSTLKITKKNCLDAYSTLFMKIIVLRHTTPDTLALVIFMKNTAEW